MRDNGHTCHAIGCKNRVRPEIFMCRSHWYRLTKSLRDAVWRTYRRGQCDDWQITRAYADAAQAAIRFVAAKEGRAVRGDEPELKLYDALAPDANEGGER